MRTETRQKYTSYIGQIAKLNNIAEAVASSSKFAVDPTIGQTLEVKIRESHAFLNNVSYQYPIEQQGEKLGMNTSAGIASTTDTAAGTKRSTNSVVAIDDKGYHCQKIDSDTHIRYALLDAWAKFPNFQQMIQQVIIRQQSLDRLMIGFNGTSRAATSDKAANPMLQDVAVGWLQKLRDHKPSNVINGAKVGAGGDYNNIDAAVTDALQELVAEWHQEAAGMVVICGSRLLNDKYLSLINSTDAPTERNALESMLSNKALGAKPTITVPYFPATAFAITSLDNLSIYVQDGSRRRRIKDHAELDQVEDFQSANVDYIVEDYDKMCMYDGVLTPDGAGGWA
jgi:P2 family phage major capsid protein